MVFLWEELIIYTKLLVVFEKRRATSILRSMWCTAGLGPDMVKVLLMSTSQPASRWTFRVCISASERHDFAEAPRPVPPRQTRAGVPF